MRRYNRLALATGGALLLTLALAPLAYAEHGSGGSGSGSDSHDRKSATTEAAKTDSSEHATEVENEQETEHHQELQTQLEQARQKVETAKQQAEQHREQAKADSTKKLDDAKLRICKNHEKTINNVMVRIGKRGDNQIALIDSVSQRVQSFYADKKLSAADYDVLLAKVNAAKATAQAAADALSTAKADFACDGTDPVGSASSFKDLMQARNDAIKAYRDAVKDLAKAVKTAAQAAAKASTTNTEDKQ
jgi:hypothetical protein